MEKGLAYIWAMGIPPPTDHKADDKALARSSGSVNVLPNLASERSKNHNHSHILRVARCSRGPLGSLEPENLSHRPLI